MVEDIQLILLVLLVIHGIIIGIIQIEQQKNIKDSSAWGNYYATSVKADDGTTELKASVTRAMLNTGKTTFTMANNIYDLAGNYREWTQEACRTFLRADRGGNYDSDGSTDAASYEGINEPFHTGGSLRFSSHFNNKVIRV